MSVEKCGAAFGKTIEMGRLHLRMSAEWPHPIIQIVDSNQQDVSSRRFCGRRSLELSGRENTATK